jgi:entry exclusion lipoprotein TrbK
MFNPARFARWTPKAAPWVPVNINVRIGILSCVHHFKYRSIIMPIRFLGVALLAFMLTSCNEPPEVMPEVNAANCVNRGAKIIEGIKSQELRDQFRVRCMDMEAHKTPDHIGSTRHHSLTNPLW